MVSAMLTASRTAWGSQAVRGLNGDSAPWKMRNSSACRARSRCSGRWMWWPTTWPTSTRPASRPSNMLFEEYVMPVARDRDFPHPDQPLSYVQDWATIHDLSSGAMVQTGNPLDVASMATASSPSRPRPASARPVRRPADQRQRHAGRSQRQSGARRWRPHPVRPQRHRHPDRRRRHRSAPAPAPRAGCASSSSPIRRNCPRRQQPLVGRTPDRRPPPPAPCRASSRTPTSRASAR